jgi:hypothetical protein
MNVLKQFGNKLLLQWRREINHLVWTLIFSQGGIVINVALQIDTILA